MPITTTTINDDDDDDMQRLSFFLPIFTRKEKKMFYRLIPIYLKRLPIIKDKF